MSLVQLRPEAPHYAGVAHPVERHLAKVEVASSSRVTRSIFLRYRGQVVRQRSAKPSLPSSNLGGTSIVAADCISFAATFYASHEKSLLTHSVAAPLKIVTAHAGLRFCFSIAVFKIKAHIHMNETTLNSQKAKHSERRVESHSEEHPVTLP